MTPERWRQIEQLYEAALARAADHRASFLEQACAGDEELRREVASLLAADGGAGSFLAAPAAEVAARSLAAQTPLSPIGRRFGRYQVLEMLGAGGMGEVYLAKDTSLDRLVALKILSPEIASDAKRMKRFIQEARLSTAFIKSSCIYMSHS